MRNYAESKRIFARGVEVSNNSYATRLNNNDLIIGASGSGKTTGYILPNLLNPAGSYIVADTKGNLYNNYGNYLRYCGYRVEKIDFSDLRQSCCYNFLDFIEYRSGNDYREQDIITIAKTLCPQQSDKEHFWDNAAVKVIAAMISYVIDMQPREDHNMITVMQLLHHYNSTEGPKLFHALEMKKPDSLAVKLFNENPDIFKADKTWACVKEFVSTNLWLFEFKDAERVFGGKTDFSFEELGKSNCVFFVNISDSDRSLDTLVNIFYTQAFQSLMRFADSNKNSRLHVPVRIFLDDFATNTVIPDFDNTISVIRSRDISVSIILQSISQLNTIYSEPESKTIINNCDHILYLGGQDIDTARYIATRVRKTVENVLDMGVDDAFFIERGARARKVDKNLPEDITTYMNRYRNECEISEINIEKE